MSYYIYNARGQMTLADRIAIETGICYGDSFKKIAKKLRRHPSTIAHEVKENRTFIKGTYYAGKDCKFARNCARKNLCVEDANACNAKCKYCRGVDCRTLCERYESMACYKHESVPYVGTFYYGTGDRFSVSESMILGHEPVPCSIQYKKRI